MPRRPDALFLTEAEIAARVGRPFTPRCVTRRQAADMLGLNPSGFSDWVRKRIMPESIPGTHRWDRKAIEAALDKLTGIAPAEDEDPFEAWRRQHEGADARG